MSLLSYNEQKAICAQQENPFVQNKPYQPDQVMEWVIDHLLGGEAPLTNEEVEHAKAVYTSAIETLLGQDLPVTQANIIGLKDKILDYAQRLETEKATPEAFGPDDARHRVRAKADVSTQPASTEPKSPAISEDYLECGGIRIKKQWVKVAAIVVVVLLIIKILK